MKKLLLTFAAVVVTMVSSFAQGNINFSNRSTADGIDAPATLIGGARVTGPDFKAQLVRVNAGSLITVGTPVAFRTGAAAGYITPTVFSVDGVPAGTAATFQMLVFQGDTFSEAGVLGRSKEVTVTLTAAPNPPAALVGLGDISGDLTRINVVPEPSTIALGVLGAAALLLRRRK